MKRNVLIGIVTVVLGGAGVFTYLAQHSLRLETVELDTGEPADTFELLPRAGTGAGADPTETTNQAITEEEPVKKMEDRPGPEGYGIKYLGEYVAREATSHKPFRYFYTKKPELGIIPVYVQLTWNNSQDSQIEVYRIYSDTYTIDDIRADLTGEVPIESHWPATVPDVDTYAQESFLTGTSTNYTTFLHFSDKCKWYASGDGCAIEVLENEYGLVPGTLTQTTGPYEWGDVMSLGGVRVLPEGKLFLVWVFGDGGAISYKYSIWDTKENTNTFVSGYGGMIDEFMTISIADGTDIKNILVLDSSIDSDEINLFDKDMFGDLPNVLFQELPEYCMGVKVVSKDRTDPKASWLLEYSFGCYNYGYDLAFRYYELDPVAETVTPLTRILYR